MSESQKPTVGRIVHYVYRSEDLPADKQHCVGEERPAVIVRVLPNEVGPGVDCCNLQVLTDGGNDGLPNSAWVTSALPSSGPVPGCWHWPERA